MNLKSLSIFLPVYNEEKIIDKTISEIERVAESITDNYEILIINDGSTDHSKEKVLEWTKKNNKIKLISHETNLGYGAALRTGFKNAQNDLILYTDADMPVYLEEVKKIPPLMEEYDLVIGYRINRGDTPRRFIYSKLYNFFLRALLKIQVKDANFSFKCIKKEAIQKCNLKARSVFIDGELLAEVVRNNFKIKEIPIVYRPRKYGKSNFDTIAAALSTMKEIIYYWLGRHLSVKKSEFARNKII